ncbi:glycerate kinase [Vulcanibacillus modesticaldus]|uniref:Glycerate kinase n=1 Tax=Vulcanibacillus modesticaldus TaxID=337097 RepID=A0A1D2YVQ7_9BACI|nr:glycerate kinase [Vulcanibacillus modesticaldus]OEF99799.1 glycerate kinase [Vulcanibacillus modesticaldus]
MKIVIASDSFKGSLNSLEVAKAIESGIKKVYPRADIIKFPIADGGEGTVQAFISSIGGELVTTNVTGPLGTKVTATYGILTDKKTAVIEMAAAAGITLVPQDQLNPLITTTYGVGELIRHALDRGCTEFIIGLGGSATNDGGAGLAQALGYKLLDADDQEIAFGGGSLQNLRRIDATNVDHRIFKANFIVASDVTNPLYGPNGATYIYGPQKGATPKMLNELDNGLKNFAKIIYRDLKKDIHNLPAAGAAGGLGGGLFAFVNATLKRGIDIIIEKANLKKYLHDADYVITGEGKIDSQTINGKVPVGVAKIAKEYNVPVIALAGYVDDKSFLTHEAGIDAIFSIINYPITVEQAMEPTTAKMFLTKNAEEIFRLIKLITDKHEDE